MKDPVECDIIIVKIAKACIYTDAAIVDPMYIITRGVYYI
jgi:hypothetical protein